MPVPTSAPVFAVGLAVAFALSAHADAPLDTIVVGKPAVAVRAEGVLETPAELAVGRRPAAIVIGDGASIDYRVSVQIRPAPTRGSVDVMVFPTDEKDVRKPAALRVVIGRDRAGSVVYVQPQRLDGATGKWKRIYSMPYAYRPAHKKAKARVAEDGLSPEGWHGRWQHLRVDVTRRRVLLWFEGLLVQGITTPEPGRGPVVVRLSRGDRVRALSVTRISPAPLLLPIDLTHHANARFKKPIRKRTLELGGLPFEVPSGAEDHLCLHQAQWVDQKRDPQSFYELHDAGPYFLHDPRMPFLRVPKADYVAAHLLAVADDDPSLTSKVTLRMGQYGHSRHVFSQVLRRDFVAEVPRQAAAKEVDAKRRVETRAGPLYHVRVPLTKAFAQDIETDSIEIELTKELQLARHRPDPNRFRIRPLGPPSGVRIAALTLERCPLQMRVTSDEPGHAFVEPTKPTFVVELQNITPAPQSYALTAKATPWRGKAIHAHRAGTVAPDQSAQITIPLAPPRRGYHDLVVTLGDGKGRTLLERHTSFAQLPPDTRQYRSRSPFGTWTWGGGHYTCKDPDRICRLLAKLGCRYGARGTPEDRARHGLVYGFEPKLDPELKRYETRLSKHPDLPKRALIFHETSISGPHVTRVPDLFHDRPPYKLDEKEKARYQQMLEEAVGGGEAVRAKYPDVHVKFGNGPLPTKEEFYRRGLPAHLFDSGGNEPGSFGRLPESQPPDWVSHNASIWMDRQLLDAYGYKDKPVRQCYEVCYPSDNPGNLSSATQADYFVRHALHSLAWEMPFIHIGMISDVGNSYYFSNWGSSGFCRAMPELNVKPAYAAIATLTGVLDGAKFVRVLPMGSPSLYGIEFERPDGKRVLAVWTVRGRRPVTLAVQGKPWTLIDGQANETNLEPRPSLVVTATPTPVYVVGKGRFVSATPGEPAYDDAPRGKAAVLTSLANMAEWTVEPSRNAELETYNFMCPRRKGDFAFEVKGKALCVTPRPIKSGKDAMPMYAVLAHRKGIACPGKPTEIGLWIDGNSGWGRIIFELTDESGQRWISIGAEADGEPNRWVLDWLPENILRQVGRPAQCDWNTDDVYGLSRINFDGWRYVGFPLPGNYPHEYHPWPANSQWRCSSDGVVHYPLALRKLIVELPKKVLHVRTWAPVARPSIQLRDLVVAEAQHP